MPLEGGWLVVTRLFLNLPMVWPKVDDWHSHCSMCGFVFRNPELTRGLCKDCIVEHNEKANAVSIRAESRIKTRAATKLLAALKDKGKDGQSMPMVMSAFFQEIGGHDEFGKLMHTEFKKAMGHGLSVEEKEFYEPSLSLRKDWFDLVARHAKAADSDKQLDVGALDEADLESILSSIALRAFQEDLSLQTAVIAQAVFNQETRRTVFEACLKADPSLVTEILENGGLIIDAESSEVEKLPLENKEVEGEDYDPAADEYKDE
jgi:hypothetical protein